MSRGENRSMTSSRFSPGRSCSDHLSFFAGHHVHSHRTGDMEGAGWIAEQAIAERFVREDAGRGPDSLGLRGSGELARQPVVGGGLRVGLLPDWPELALCRQCVVPDAARPCGELMGQSLGEQVVGERIDGGGRCHRREGARGVFHEGFGEGSRPRPSAG